ncbi:MAG: DUF1971 domain-containing protein [Arenicella sp.]
MRTIPENVSEYSRTASFTCRSVPKGLLKNHSTKDGVWGQLVVERGSILYTVTDPEDLGSYTLNQGDSGVIVPMQLHWVKPLSDDLLFHVVFLR